jgi:hypothetical protein
MTGMPTSRCGGVSAGKDGHTANENRALGPVGDAGRFALRAGRTAEIIRSGPEPGNFTATRARKKKRPMEEPTGLVSV